MNDFLSLLLGLCSFISGLLMSYALVHTLSDAPLNTNNTLYLIWIVASFYFLILGVVICTLSLHPVKAKM